MHIKSTSDHISICSINFLPDFYISHFTGHCMPVNISAGTEPSDAISSASFPPISGASIPGRFRRQNQWPSVVNVDQSFVSCRRYYQKAFCIIAALEWCTADRRHENGLAICPVNKVGLFLVAFLFHSNHPSAKQIARPCCQRGLNILLVAAVSTRALISGGLSHHPGA